MGKQLRAEVEVEASPERVWEVLADFAAYRQWNPFITQVPGLFDGEHRFTLEPAGSGRVRVVQQEEFRGLAARPVLAVIGKPTLAGFELMNQALKDRVEQPTHT